MIMELLSIFFGCVCFGILCGLLCAFVPRYLSRFYSQNIIIE